MRFSFLIFYRFQKKKAKLNFGLFEEGGGAGGWAPNVGFGDWAPTYTILWKCYSHIRQKEVSSVTHEAMAKLHKSLDTMPAEGDQEDPPKALK